MSEADSGRSIMAVLASYPARLGDAAQAAVDRPIPDGAWGPIEVVRHLIAVESDVHQARLEDLRRSDAPTWGWEEPGPWPGEPGLTLTELLDRFATLRVLTIRTVDGLPASGWARAGVHATLGILDVTGLLANMADHDRAHVDDLIDR